MSKAPIKVCITGAAGQIGYAILPMIASGQMFGADQPVILSLLDIPACVGNLTGVMMELEDGYYPLLKAVAAYDDPLLAFADCDACVALGAFPRKAGMERKDLLEKNAGIFRVQGEAMNKVAKKSIKVLVVGNPANTNALLLKTFAPDIPAQNFTALTRLDLNRAKAQIAKKAGVAIEDVKNIAIWGNHSATQYPEVNNGYVVKGGEKVPVRTAVADDAYLNGEFITCVQQRGAAIIKARGGSSVFSAARAAVCHMHDWFCGTAEGEHVSMGVYSDGSYGIQAGLVYSFPVTCKAGEWTIVQGLAVDDFSREKLTLTEKELIEERDTAMELIGAK
eukprot:TRINITY_DN537_c0_g1_i3.p1 TRINITY_DN537_c0_g1~~TRINITY_DN537_c0_g1_i3.p1  ORF type:complete len:335 (+),score=208.72 TRINITY_DN537_c0_g1_i3:88-1092(+)